MSEMTIGERWAEFKRSWRLGEPMRCPACRGSGDPSHHVFREFVYWKGQRHEVCHNCAGRGIV